MDGALPLRSTGLTTFTVRSNGVPLPGTFRIVAIDIRRELDRVPTAQLIVQDGDAAAQTFSVSEGAELAPGAAIEIDAGYDREEELLFKGIVTRQRIEAGRRGATLLHVDVRHAVSAATAGRRSRTFTDSSDADVIADLLGAGGLTVEIEPTEVQPQIVQHQVTDWDFALQRSGALGLVCDCDGDTVRFFRPDLSKAAEVTFAYGRDLHRMELELDAESQLAAVEAGVWSPSDQELLLAEAEDAPSPADAATPGLHDVLDARETPRHAGARDQPAADAWAAARLERSRLAAVRGIVEVQGTAEAVPGAIVELKGLGERFNGSAFVSGVRHELGRGDWMTTVQIGLDPRLYHERRRQAAAPPAAGRIPPVSGLQIGLVSALGGDPAGEDRIEVRLVAVTETEGLVWARIAALDAGPDRGAVFRPEIGDEVVLGFLDDDPRDPVVLGALHSSARAAPIPGADDNHQKGYVTRSGMRLLFDDETTKVTVETPGGAVLTLDDGEGSVTLTDQNGNSLKMEASTLELSATKDMKLKAGRNISIEGLGVDLKASSALSVEGSGSAELKSGGQTVVKGSIVMIN